MLYADAGEADRRRAGVEVVKTPPFHLILSVFSEWVTMMRRIIRGSGGTSALRTRNIRLLMTPLSCGL